jgi:hypothetical protein
MKRKDRTGQRNGALTAIRCLGSRASITASGKHSTDVIWICRCDCGTEIEVKSDHLRQVSSCRRKECRFYKPRNRGARSGFASLIYKYRNQAKYRNIPFLLTNDQFAELTKKDCYYCGDPPLQRETYSKRIDAEAYVYNGVDRIDSSLGYTEDNCVPACGMCNKMKLHFPLKVFFDQIEKINNRRLQRDVGKNSHERYPCT